MQVQVLSRFKTLEDLVKCFINLKTSISNMATSHGNAHSQTDTFTNKMPRKIDITRKGCKIEN